jgi:hypothetical protein
VRFRTEADRYSPPNDNRDISTLHSFSISKVLATEILSHSRQRLTGLSAAYLMISKAKVQAGSQDKNRQAKGDD